MLAFETLDFLSFDIGTILFSWLNLLILFFGLKHFLFKPVNEILEKRQQEVDQSIQEAQDAKIKAEATLSEYEEKLSNAKEESAEMIRKATRKAQQRSDEIVAAAKEDASNILARGREELSQEKRRAESELRGAVSELAVLVAEKVVEREVSPEDHARLIDEFIDSVGDAK